jgi:hypothetical protein
MKRSIFFLLFILLIAQDATAQKIKGAAGFVKLGYGYSPKSDAAFAQIAPQGMNKFTNNYALFGLEGYIRTGQLIIGLEGTVGGHDYNSVNTQYAEGYTFSSYLRFGWVLENCKNHQLYPSIGIGPAALILNTYTKANGDSKHQNQKYLYLASPSLDLGLNYDIIVGKIADDASEFGGFMLGFRTGYRFSSNQKEWLDDNGNKISVPTAYANRGFYATITIGGGGFREK